MVFKGKTVLLQIRRAVLDAWSPVSRQAQGRKLDDAPVVGESRAEIWNHASPAEFPLTAGKVQNLRVACSALHGLEFPAGAVFSFS